MAEKLTARTALTAPISTDITYVVDDPAGTPLGKKSTLSDLSKGLVAANIPSNTTPDSTDTLTNKTFDANGTGNSLSNVDVADLANGTDGELITWDAAGAPATVAVGTAAQVLTSNGAGAAPTFQAAAGGGATNAFLQASAGQTNASVTSIGQQAVVLLPNSVTNEVNISWVAPSDLTSITSVKLFWASDTASGNGAFSFFARVTTDDESSTAGGETDSIALTTYAVSSTAYGLKKVDVTAMVNGLTINAGELLGLQVRRFGSDGGDSIADAYIYGLEIIYS